MDVTPIKTHKITEKDTDITRILDRYLKGSNETKETEDTKVALQEKSVLAVTSKIVAICEGRLVKAKDADKDSLAQQEADMYLPRSSNKYGVMVSVKNGMFIASAGIDESNGNGNFVLWPKNPQESANTIREYLCQKFGLKEIGVIITDSRNTPLRWGVTGVSIAHSGFAFLRSYIGKPDIFGRLLHVEKVNVADTLAAAAVGLMGEGEEQTPLAIITNAAFVDFQDRNPSKEELAALKIKMEDDIYAGMLLAAPWIQRKQKLLRGRNSRNRG